MSDEPFQRPGGPTRPASTSWPYETPLPEESQQAASQAGMPAAPEVGSAENSTVGRMGLVRFRNVVAVGLIALLLGAGIGILSMQRPTPTATPITVDSFPQELFGLSREDFKLRDGGYEVVMDRLNTHFEAQLDGYRFAYGGEGAQFRYGEFITLTIVNGQLAPDVPIMDDTEWATPTVISLRTQDTSCVSWEANNPNGFVVIDVETGLPLDPVLIHAPERKAGQTMVWTDCVLFDKQRNLALRLEGRGSSLSILGAAGQFRDELERIHANLMR